MTKACCQPEYTKRKRKNVGGVAQVGISSLDGKAIVPSIIDIPGGRGFIGTDIAHHETDEETPFRHQKRVPFRMDAYAVTNARFAEFVRDTGFITEAERLGDSFVFAGFLPQDTQFTKSLPGAPWWRMVAQASWQKPFGPEVKQGPKADHPVVHVSWHDAVAFAQWAGGRLPLEAEWEHAARGGLGDVLFPWGDNAPNDFDTFPCNIWQGRFPVQNLAKDGYVGTAPVDAFSPNGYGLYQMAGNVWEWTAQDFRVRSMKKTVKSAHIGKDGYKVVKGGSFLCHQSYCYRYRIAARTSNAPDSTTSHTGFRVVYDIV